MQGCITRSKTRAGEVEYYDPNGDPITATQELNRIKRIAVPPAYRNVCISPIKSSRIQATAYDKRGRKQYRYSPTHKRDATREKFRRMVSFGKALPAIRRDIRSLLEGTIMDRRKGLAMALVDRCRFRPGASGYVKRNGTHGAATVRSDHVTMMAAGARVSFNGKRNITNSCMIKDGKLVRELSLLRQHQNLANPKDMNNILPAGLFVKDMRTWGANVEFVKAFIAKPDAPIRKYLKQVSTVLHNTPSVCKSSYIMPELLKFCKSNKLPPSRIRYVKGLSRHESILMNILKHIK